MNKIQQITSALYSELEPLKELKQQLFKQMKEIIEENHSDKMKKQLLYSQYKFIEGKVEGYYDIIQLIEEINNIPIYPAIANLFDNDDMQVIDIEKTSASLWENKLYIYLKHDCEIINVLLPLFEEEENTKIIQLETEQAKLSIIVPFLIQPNEIKQIIIYVNEKEFIFVDFKAEEQNIQALPNKIFKKLSFVGKRLR